jgi:uncharacterized membrane protein
LERPHERFTARLEAFSDLVFGFSLSLLATRLDVPARVEDVFDPTRWAAIIGTFAFVCRFWLEHYRIFRHQFVAQMADAVVNFIFLFAIAILPYALQTFLRFDSFLPSFALYAGDVALILLTLAILRVRSLGQRRNDPDLADRLRAWRRSLAQCGVALLVLGLLIALRFYDASFREGMRLFAPYFIGLFCLIVIAVRRGVQQLPAFLTA